MPASGACAFEALIAAFHGTLPPDDGWGGVIEVANRHLVAPALFTSLREGGLLQHVPEEARSYLAFLHERNEERNRSLHAQATECIEALNEAGVEPLLIKGTALLMLLDAKRLGCRMMSDLDMLVTEADRAAALARIGRLGYAALEDAAGPHALGKFFRPKDAAALDLHMRPPGPQRLFADEAPGARREVRQGRLRFFVPSNEEWIVQLIAHDMIRDRRLFSGIVDLRRLLDCREVSAMGGTVDWDAVRRRLASPMLALAREVFFLNLERFAGVPVNGRKAGVLARLFHRRQLAIECNPAVRRLDGRVIATLLAIWRGTRGMIRQ
ncbi:nucleotidyltransferase family protein [Rhizobiales bacterium]|uniref:nucleotidyltransferase family protein n=1 Tax=Hongsoonwoonella zoysiae TaxID=2821844 RepID=UPI00155FB36F|nr:nucleotidyltransferase family protein [Hongsoonwoonella zoysiae]NRG17879.1 nucleotidyltransferase family protein [Hongsoonwoonella zoysiae]